ncbi:MAG: sensor histidine kinase [Agriterribacter sp.]
MEFDNDRIRKHTRKIESFYWILLGCIYPLINGVSIFLKDIVAWPVLFLISMVLLPVYFFYSRIAGPVLLRKQSRLFFSALTVLTFLVVQVFLFALYFLISKLSLSPVAQTYFKFSYATGIREAVWTLINMALSIAVYFIKTAIDEKEERFNLQKDNVFFKLRYLRAQLNPHFLFNTLNSIYSLSLQKSDKTPEVVIKLADLMRYLIYECNEERIPLDKEIAFIKTYMEIEKIRYKADIRFSVEGETSHVFIEPFLFIAFIENAFKHAMDHSFSEPFIYITLKVSDEQIVLNVINSCDADLGDQAKRMNGKGISNSKRLLELLYPDSHALNIIQTDKVENRNNTLRMRNARERLELLYPDAYTLDVLLNKSTFTVSLIIKSKAA